MTPSFIKHPVFLQQAGMRGCNPPHDRDGPALAAPHTLWGFRLPPRPSIHCLFLSSAIKFLFQNPIHTKLLKDYRIRLHES